MDHHRGSQSTVKLSKALSWLLRHNAESEGFTLLEGGFLPVEDILKHRRFVGYTVENVEEVVKNCQKQRFGTKEGSNGKLLIRANQGHSMKTVDVELEEITQAQDCLKVIHGTYFKAWNLIQRSGLSRMNRNHIHFAAGEPGDQGVISGMRGSAQVYIYIDVDKALRDGIKFYKSANNVILSPGNADGLILPEYFKTVKNMKNNQVLS
eukprot:GFUD01007283.1.p1 GENE.GFUD01007283.1~~GFUD01007283.1.p1  ORF type:complete len:208 (+),score=43.44 GFUD01007283.1:46-669(+)